MSSEEFNRIVTWALIFVALGFLLMFVLPIFVVAYPLCASTIQNPHELLSKNPQVDYTCRNEVWMNQSTPRSILHQGSLGYYGMTEPVSPVYRVCYYRDGSSTKTQVDEWVGDKAGFMDSRAVVYVWVTE